MDTTINKEHSSDHAGLDTSIAPGNIMKGTNSPKIRVVKQPPSFVFSREWFDVELDLSSVASALENQTSELCADLHDVHDENISSYPISQVEESSPTLSMELQHPEGEESTLPRKVQLMIKDQLDMTSNPRSYCIRFYVAPKYTGIGVEEPVECFCRPIQLVTAKIKLDSNWDAIFYKDEGGREKGLQVRAKLCNQNDEILKGKHIPLKLSLHYDNDELSKVMKQEETLRIMGPQKQYIDPDSGETLIVFRIEDVSKNHQGHKFRLLVSPDSSRIADVGGAYTEAITVRSKRNKRVGSPRKSSKSDSPSDRLHHRTSSPSLETSSEPHHVRGDSCWDRNLHPETEDMIKAMNRIMEWTKEVITVLPALKWNLIGYCQNPDGSPDYSKPNHVMPYPNDCISRILNMYGDETRQHLRVINDYVTSSIHDNNPSHLMLGAYPHQYPTHLTRGSMHMIDHSPQPSHNSPPLTPLHTVTPIMHIQSPPDSDFRKRARKDSDAFWMQSSAKISNKLDLDELGSDDLIKSVEYILARNLHSARGDKLGFPLFNHQKEIVGFYVESSTQVGEGTIVAIQSMNDFGQREIAEASQLLEDEINHRSPAVHRLKDFLSLRNMLDHVLVFDWSKDLNHNGV